MIENKKELIKIEEIEYHYFQEIKFMLEQDKDKMLKGLASKEEIKEDWENVFFKNNDSKKNSDSLQEVLKEFIIGYLIN